nr:Chain C, PEPTIDE LEU-ALA-GLN-LEU-GLN-VAL-ALA [Sus scrofa]
KLAQLQVAYHQ